MAHLEWKDKSGHVVALRFDSVKVVEHSLTADVTTHPVEKGPDVADNVRPERPSVSLTGLVSATPLFAVASLLERDGNREALGSYRQVKLEKSPGKSVANALQGGIVQAGLDLIAGALGPKSFDALVFDNIQGRIKEATTILTEALNEARLVKFVDEAADYEDMVITGRVVTRTAEGGKCAIIQCELVQIKIVESKTVESPIPAQLRGAGLNALGSVAALLGNNGNVDEKKREQVKSMAASLYDGAFGGLVP
jgi:hypothetical protein